MIRDINYFIVKPTPSITKIRRLNTEKYCFYYASKEGPNGSIICSSECGGEIAVTEREIKGGKVCTCGKKIAFIEK